MKQIKRTEISLDIEETILICKSASPASAWCAGCGRVAHTLTADEAAAFSGTSLRAVYSAVERGHLHFIQTADGLLRVCLESLAAQTVNGTL